MGSRSAAYCCRCTTNAITYIYHNHGFDDVNYLDDLGAAEVDSRAEEAYDCLGWILDTIGIDESKGKAMPPAFVIVFLGILINAITMMLEITEERRKEIRNLLQQWMEKRSASLIELQSLIGKLSFVCSTVCAGRVFISRLINQIHKYPKNGNRRLNKDMKMDIAWWYHFMSEFDGISIIPEDWSTPNTIFATDATLNMCRAWSEPEFFKAKFPRWMKNMDFSINEYELAAFLLALKVWKHKIRNKNLLAYCNNQCTVEVINKGKANNKHAQGYLREIAYILATANAALKVVYILMEVNRIPDALSRWEEGEAQHDRFYTLTRGLELKEKCIKSCDFEPINKW